MATSEPAIYWKVTKLGGKPIFLMPQHLPEAEHERRAVLSAYAKAGYLITKVEHYHDGRIVNKNGL